MPADVHSFARPTEARVTHLELDLRADFDARTLSGTAALDVETGGGTGRVVLDTDGLEIERVEDGDGAPLDWRLGDADPVLGRPLEVDLGAAERIVVTYRTREDAAAVQWLTPAQTSGDSPFLFTQGQAILTRTWIPCQDTPSVRHPWTGRIVVPDGLRAVMSAEQLTPEGEPTDGGRAFRFRMPHPVPSYLVALAIGDLQFREVGARSGVYAEPALIDAAAAEFEDTERMIEAAEELYGPYLWGRYDLLVLPPSFPFGGMENPCLTFATPTIIAGDKSLVSLVAHELAHSWSGNLVTNAVWADLWLNEGFTVYFENRIMEVIYGEDDARMLRVLGWQDLQQDLRELGADSKETRLELDLAGRNPDDAFSNVPYEKGALFLRTIERIVGRERFDAFLADYFDRFRFRSMTSARFLAHLRESLFADDEAGWDELDPEAWVHGAGLPASARRPESPRFAAVDEARGAFVAGGAPPEAAWSGWTTHERLHFLRGLDRPLSEERLRGLDAALGLSGTGNSELRFEWLRIGIRNRYEPSFDPLRDFLTRQGRRKFLRPLYADLVRTNWGKSLAR
ncbi:MAG: M1 family metallopeptidase, partial [Planctomycetota bacterium JB042]